VEGRTQGEECGLFGTSGLRRPYSSTEVWVFSKEEHRKHEFIRARKKKERNKRT